MLTINSWLIRLVLNSYVTLAVQSVLWVCFRLFWPKSRCFDYLYQDAEALLRNFPVQATISFYEESESEESDELEQDSGAELDD